MREVSEKFELNEVNLRTLYKGAFGYTGIPFLGLKSVGKDKIVNREDFKDFTANDNTPQLKDFDRLSVKETGVGFTSRSSFLGTKYFMPVRLNDVPLPNEPIISVRLKKVIVKTSTVGSISRCSIKELVGFEDAIIQIDGMAINGQEPNKFPEEHISRLNDLYQLRRAMTIDCGLTRILGITKVVIESFDIKPQAGYPGAVPFQMNLVMDEDYAYKLIKSNA